MSHFFDEIHIQLPFSLNEKNSLLFQTNDINIDDGAEAPSFFGFIGLYDDDVFEDRDHTTRIMREMDDNYHIKSDNIDTHRLYTKVDLRVVSTVSARHDCHAAATQQAEHR